jgi:hypothetical protein
MLESAVRQFKNGLELVRSGKVIGGFEAFTLRAKGEKLTRTVGSHCFNFCGRACGNGAHLFALVKEKEPEARRHFGSKDGDFNKAMTKIHKKAVVWSAFAFRIVMRMSFRNISMAVAFASVPNQMVEAKSHQSPTRNPRKPTANLVAQFDIPSDQNSVDGDQQDKAQARWY